MEVNTVPISEEVTYSCAKGYSLSVGWFRVGTYYQALPYRHQLPSERSVRCSYYPVVLRPTRFERILITLEGCESESPTPL
jgi:hypothetical protein